MYVCQKAFKNLSCYRSLVFHNKEIYNRFDVELIKVHVKKSMVGFDIDYILDTIQNKLIDCLSYWKLSSKYLNYIWSNLMTFNMIKNHDRQLHRFIFAITPGNRTYWHVIMITSSPFTPLLALVLLLKWLQGQTFPI